MGNISVSSALPTLLLTQRYKLLNWVKWLFKYSVVVAIARHGFHPHPLFVSPGEPSPTRREAVKKKTAEYLMRAEQISSLHLRGSMGQGSTQTVVSGANV